MKLGPQKPHAYLAPVNFFSEAKELRGTLQALKSHNSQLVALNVTGNGTLLNGLDSIALHEDLTPELLLARWSQEMGWPCVLAEPPDGADFLRAMSQPLTSAVFDEVANVLNYTQMV